MEEGCPRVDTSNPGWYTSTDMAHMPNPFAIATAQAKRQGFQSFNRGSRGQMARSRIAEAVKRRLGKG